MGLYKTWELLEQDFYRPYAIPGVKAETVAGNYTITTKSKPNVYYNFKSCIQICIKFGIYY